MAQSFGYALRRAPLIVDSFLLSAGLVLLSILLTCSDTVHARMLRPSTPGSTLRERTAARRNARLLRTTSPRSSTARIWGSYVGDSTEDITTFESLVGKKMNWVALFLSDADSFPSQYGSVVRDQGKTLLIFWEPRMSLDSLLSGSADEQLKKFVAGAKSYGGPVVFAPFHEMNGNWDEWNGTVGTNTSTKLINSWKRVHGLFAGATNVKFGWVVNHESVPDTFLNRIEAHYPGDAYVDYVGIDGFNWGDPWQTFDQIFRDALQRLRAYNKPIYIFSTGSMEGGRKAAWITDALVTQMNAHPEVRGWLWFNVLKERDWRVNSDPASLKAFQDAIR